MMAMTTRSSIRVKAAERLLSGQGAISVVGSYIFFRMFWGWVVLDRGILSDLLIENHHLQGFAVESEFLARRRDWCGFDILSSDESVDVLRQASVGVVIYLQGHREFLVHRFCLVGTRWCRGKEIGCDYSLGLGCRCRIRRWRWLGRMFRHRWQRCDGSQLSGLGFLATCQYARGDNGQQNPFRTRKPLRWGGFERCW
jgi:hypothetical protein